MGKKREPDEGLKYLNLINFNRARGKNALEDRLIRLYGKDKAYQELDKIDKIERGTTEFYDYKNSSYELSMAFNEAYDGDVIRKACNYIAAHKDCFGKTILEVGCESGNMTGFLALTFPDSKITAIDESEAAIRIAQLRTDRLNVKNVEFKHCALKDITEKYDTVFCMRTIRDNIEEDDYPFVYEPIAYLFAFYQTVTETYTDEIIKRVKDFGKLCIFDRLASDPLMCGWMMALSEKKYGIVLDSYEKLICDDEIDEHTSFQAFICQSGIMNDTEELCNLWNKAVGVDLTRANKSNKLSSWDALVYLHINAGKLLEGVYILDPRHKDKVIGRFGVFTDCDDPNIIYYLISNNDMVEVYYVPADYKEEAIKRMRENIKHIESDGMKSRPIKPNKDIVEGS